VGSLGSYDQEIGVIKIYEELIVEEAGSRSRRKRLSYLWLRELVRLHEHSHAFLQRAQLNPLAFRALLACTEIILEQAERLTAEIAFIDQRKWCVEMLAVVLEPLTELVKQVALVWALGVHGLELAHKAEEDLGVPNYYRRWRDLEDLIGGSTSYELLLALILYVAKSRVWRDWINLRQGLAGLVEEAGGPEKLEACRKLIERWLS